MPHKRHEVVFSNLPLGIRFYESNVSTSGYVPFHWHNSLEILCVLSGSLKLTIDGTVCHIGPDEFIVISSGLIHDVANTPNRTLVLQIPMKILRRFEYNPEKIYFDVQKTTFPNIYTEIVAEFQQMNNFLQQKNPGYLYDAEIILLNIFKLLMLHFTRKEPLKSSLNTTLKDIIIYINEHYREKLKVKELAAINGYNANYLSRLFHSQMDMPLIEYIYKVRLSHFHEVLLSSDNSIQELMTLYGLKNKRTSREIFQQMYGLTPLAARKQYLNTKA